EKSKMIFCTETNRYLFRGLAIMEILSTPDRFSYNSEVAERCAPCSDELKTVTVTSSIPSLAAFAHAHGMSYRQLNVYNPWLLTNHLTVPGGKSYDIAVVK